MSQLSTIGLQGQAHRIDGSTISSSTSNSQQNELSTNATLQYEYNVVEMSLKSMKEIMTTKDREIAYLKKQYEKAKNLYNDYLKEYDNLVESNKVNTCKYNKALVQIRKYKLEIEKSKQINVELEAANEFLLEQINLINSELSEKNESLDKSTQEKEEMCNHFKTIETCLTSKDGENTELREHAKRVDAKLAKIKNHYREKIKRIQSETSSQIDALKSKYSKIKIDKKLLSNEYDSLKLELDEFKCNVKETEDALVKTLQNSVNHNQDMYREARNENCELKSQIEFWKKKYNSNKYKFLCLERERWRWRQNGHEGKRKQSQSSCESLSKNANVIQQQPINQANSDEVISPS